MELSEVKKNLEKAKSGINDYLLSAIKNDMIDQQLYNIAEKNTYSNLERWVLDKNIDTISPNFKKGIINAIENEKWEQIVNAFRQYLSFGTGGIRGMMAFDKESIVRIKEQGLDAPVIKGPNTINNILLLLTSVGVAKFGIKEGFKKIVIGYDSRIRGYDFASIVAELFLGYGYQVYLFDAPCPYPEVTFAIPFEKIKADVGILISASHNDYRYNGYKLSCGNGSQFDPEERDSILNEYIMPLFNNSNFSESTEQILKYKPLNKAEKGKLWFLSGENEVPEFDYFGLNNYRINVHDEHKDHIKSFLISKELVENQKNSARPVNIGFCAYHGAGNIAVPRLLSDSGFKDAQVITENGLNELNGLFPSFPSEAGHERQPDPGDKRAAEVAVNSYKKQFKDKGFKELDILIGTDPDADRCGVVVKVPENQQSLYKNDWCLFPADDLWALIMWYRLTQGKENVKPEDIPDFDKKFIVLSHTTSDSIVKLAEKYNIGVLKTWVGFAMLAASTRDLWNGDEALYKKYSEIKEGLVPGEVNFSHPIIFNSSGLYSSKSKRSFNIAAMEQSNGFSILGGPPKDNHSLGTDGHVRDKDGTFAAILAAELAVYAKEHDTTLFDLLDEKIYLDPGIGLFVNGYEPDPLDGEYPGIRGDRIKKNILRRAFSLFHLAKAGDLSIAGMQVKSANIYRTGKYDRIYPPSMEFQFPDEGIRLYFDDDKLNHVTMRPSGTGNSLRFHTQLYAPINDQGLDVNIPANKKMLMKKLIKSKKILRDKTDRIFEDIRLKLKAPKKSNY